MTLQDALIILIASLIGIAYLLKIRNYDIYEKESFLKLLLVAIAGGIVSIISSLLMYEFVEVRMNFIDAVFKIGIIEEVSKLLALIIMYRFIRNDFNEIVDGIIYITSVSLGFAIIENIFYATNHPEPFLLLFQRSIYSVIGHISFSGYMGIAFYIHKRIKKNIAGILLTVLISALAHGFYDGVIFHRELNFLFQAVFLGLIILQLWLLRISLGFSAFRKKLDHEIFNKTNKTIFLRCSNCFKSIKTAELEFSRIRTGICENCGYYGFSSENLKKLFNYFRPVFKFNMFFKNIKRSEKIVTLDDGGKILFNTKLNYLSADINELSGWLEISNHLDRKRVLEIPIFGFLLKHIGLKYLM